jgi:flagellar hook-associated protein 1 FlgK
VPAAPLMSDLLSALNSNATGSASMASSAWTPTARSLRGAPPLERQALRRATTTQRGVGGPSISQLFGLGVQERSTRAGRFGHRSRSSRPDQAGVRTAGPQRRRRHGRHPPGDGRGALGVSASGDVPILFQAAGSLGQVTMSVQALRLRIRRRHRPRGRRRGNPQVQLGGRRQRGQRPPSVRRGGQPRRELVNLTTYQQAFNASARMIQAASDLFDTLLNLV